jgi:hypothetical protein
MVDLGIGAEDFVLMSYRALYLEGTSVKIASRQELKQFRDTWRFHHRLEAEQLSYANHTARISWIGYYHGGDVLYRLENIPGIWHESCLRLAVSN